MAEFDLYSILACPLCKVAVQRQGDKLICTQCQRTYPIIDGVPVLLPDGSIPATDYQHELQIRTSYGVWLYTVVMQSLPASSIILNLGAGNMAVDLPNVIRMDVTLTPYVDVVGDAHALPFLPSTFDFVLSLAVTEHLRQPFVAAQEAYDVLRNGGYVYSDCNFVFAYHGYPHHYFNASQQGLEQVYSMFEILRSGVAPFQMPAFMLRMVLSSYLKWMAPSEKPNILAFRSLIQQILEEPLGSYDILFTEEAALNVAAGVFIFGRKALDESSEVVPKVIQDLWEQEPQLKSRFPDLFNLGTARNIMLWAKQEGRQRYTVIDQVFSEVVPFRKSDTVTDEGQKQFDALPVIEPVFINVPDFFESKLSLGAENQHRQHVEELKAVIEAKDDHIRHLESLIKRIESGRVMTLLRLIQRK
jgi:uncharacterized protein YbaR (Trm112 family)/SAM-dependent methyltransferase